jgi:hypothetical protein
MRMLLTLLGLGLAATTSALADGASPTHPRAGVKPFQDSDASQASRATMRPGGVQPYEAVELTEEEREAARHRARNKMGTWRETVLPPPESHFPWMPLGFTLLTFAVVTPFAWSSYRRHVEQAPDTRAFGTQRRRAAPKDPPAP